MLDDDDESGPEAGSLGRPSDVLEDVAGFLVTFEVSELDAETFRLRPADGGPLVIAVLSDEGPPEISARRSPICANSKVRDNALDNIQDARTRDTNRHGADEEDACRRSADD